MFSTSETPTVPYPPQILYRYYHLHRPVSKKTLIAIPLQQVSSNTTRSPLRFPQEDAEVQVIKKKKKDQTILITTSFGVAAAHINSLFSHHYT
jgi:hypothetical protein